MRRETDRVAFYQALAARPHGFDFLQALRHIEALHESMPRLGEAIRPGDEPIRLGQEPALDFAPASLTKFDTQRDGAPKLLSRFFGLFGPNGALPLYLTEYARDPLAPLPERYVAYSRRTRGGSQVRARPSAAPLVEFLDIFHHRFLALFYRAWRVAQPTVSFDRRDDRFAGYVGALIGTATPQLAHSDALMPASRLHFAGHLGRHVRNADGLEAILSVYFALPVRVEQYVGNWLSLPESERTRISNGPEARQIAKDSVIGGRVYDRQHRIRLHFGPLRLHDYVTLLPGRRAGRARLRKLRDWLRTYCCFEFDWDVRLTLQHDAVPAGLKLGRSRRLGWTTWLGKRSGGLDADDLVLDVEKALARHERRVARSATTVPGGAA